MSQKLPPFRALSLGFTMLAGCSSYSIEEGVWQREVLAFDVRTKEQVSVPDLKVRVAVEYADEKETVEMVPIAIRKEEGWVPLRSLKAIYGVIPSGEDRGDRLPVLIIQKQVDRDWVFNMIGSISSPETIDGRAFFARHRYADVSLEGRWRMTYVGDE